MNEAKSMHSRLEASSAQREYGNPTIATVYTAKMAEERVICSAVLTQLGFVLNQPSAIVMLFSSLTMTCVRLPRAAQQLLPAGAAVRTYTYGNPAVRNQPSEKEGCARANRYE